MANSKNKREGIMITIGCQKGGVAKTTTSGIIAYMLSESGKKVLLVDTDSQGNLTEMFTGVPIRKYRQDEELGLMAAIIDKDPALALKTLSPTLDLIIGDELSGVFSRLLWQNILKGYKTKDIIKELLEPIKYNYDYIIIDTAPALSDMLTQCLIASDYAISMYEPSIFCFSALATFTEAVQTVIETRGETIKLLGIIPTLKDGRRLDNTEFLQLLYGDPFYGPLCFKPEIPRLAPIGRLNYSGFYDNKEIRQATKPYVPILAEMIKRIKKDRKERGVK